MFKKKKKEEKSLKKSGVHCDNPCVIGAGVHRRPTLSLALKLLYHHLFCPVIFNPDHHATGGEAVKRLKPLCAGPGNRNNNLEKATALSLWCVSANTY